MTEECKSNILPEQSVVDQQIGCKEVNCENIEHYDESNETVDCFKNVSFTGQVKWFNTKAGYGFITVRGNNAKYLELEQRSQENGVDISNICDKLNEKDIFVHYTAINVVNTQYKYLIQGEYVEFNIIKTNNDKYEYHSSNVHGINGGTIMCENRSTNMLSYNKRTSGNSGRSVTYVGNDGVRHYSKVYRSSNNVQSTNLKENGEERTQSRNDGRKRNSLSVSSNLPSHTNYSYDNEYSKPVFNISIHNPNESGNQDFKEVARGRNKRKQMIATKG